MESTSVRKHDILLRVEKRKVYFQKQVEMVDNGESTDRLWCKTMERVGDAQQMCNLLIIYQ